MINPFFKNNGPIKVSDILRLLNLGNFKIVNDQKIIDIKDLFTSEKKSLISIILYQRFIYIRKKRYYLFPF